MRAVSNTSPLSNLASIGRLDLLRAQFSEVLIPQAVMRELSAHPDPDALALLQTAMRDQWIKLSVADDSHLLKLLLLQLHAGEAGANRRGNRRCRLTSAEGSDPTMQYQLKRQHIPIARLYIRRTRHG